MAAEYTAIAAQIINPGESAVFTESPSPCNRGLVRHRDGTPNFLLAGMNKNPGCRCYRRSVDYSVNFGANISVPEGGTPGPISVSIAVDGAALPSSQMKATPSAVNEYSNVSREMSVPIWAGCCETVTIVNTSTIPIQMSNATIKFDQ